LSALDMLVHTSLREGLARCLPQSLLAGVPTIAFDVDGAREVVVSGETGELIPPLDTSGLAAAILKLAGNAGLRGQLGQTGRDRCREQFDHHVMTRQIRKLYQKVLGAANSS